MVEEREGEEEGSFAAVWEEDNEEEEETEEDDAATAALTASIKLPPDSFHFTRARTHKRAT